MKARPKSRTPLAMLALTMVLVAGCDRPSDHATRDIPSAAPAAPIAEVFPTGFTSATATVNGTTLHYVVGGQGPALILIHGFPENWSAYAEIMPRLATWFRVVAVDLRGIGGSTPPAKGGYDAATMAEDVHQLALKLGLDRAYVVGHDFGGRVTYAMARLYPTAVRGAMIVSTPIPGIDPWEKFKTSPEVWHFGFHKIPGFAEELLAGRERIYIGYFMRDAVVDPKSITDADVARYAPAYARPGRLAAAMGPYRAFDVEEQFGKERRGSLDVPIVLVGGNAPGKSVAMLLPGIAKGLKDAGVRSVTVETIADSAHYVIDEKPAEFAALIEHYGSAAQRAERP